jgi:hypothetical protein
VEKSLLRKPKKIPPEMPTVADNHGMRSNLRPLPREAKVTETDIGMPLAVL